MNVPELGEKLLHHLRTSGNAIGLVSSRTQVAYVSNWGGFVNASFSVTDGQKRLHLKLAKAGEDQSALRRWHSVHPRLEERYHAPRVIGWIDVAGTEYGGLVFEHIDGEIFDARQTLDVLPHIVSVVHELHEDRELRRTLQLSRRVQSDLDALRSRYIRCFEEDLAFLEHRLPPFVSHETYSWMAEETRKLEQMARSSGAFDRAATTPCHYDLWANNILVTRNSDWFLLDWDDLAIGDPALDFSTLVWPLVHGENAVNWRELPIPTPDDHFGDRMEFYKRVQMFDWVLDTLADWVDCALAPDHMEVMRSEKESTHLRYLEMYRETYGFP